MLSSWEHCRAQYAPLAAPLPPALHSKACSWLRGPLRRPVSWRRAQQPTSTCMPASAFAAQCGLPPQLRCSSSSPAHGCSRWARADGPHLPASGRGKWRGVRRRELQRDRVCSYGGDSARQAAGEHSAAGSSGASVPEGEVWSCSTELPSYGPPAAGVLACLTEHSV